MSVYTKSGNAINLDGVWNFAKSKVLTDVQSSFFARTPILTYLAGKVKSESKLGRPGTLAVIGGSSNFDSVSQQIEAEGEVHETVHTGKVGGGKYLGMSDTTPSTGNDAQNRKFTTAVFRWTGVYMQPIKVDQMYLRIANSRARYADAVKRSVDQAQEELYDKIALDLWRGNPTDQSADVWDAPLGVLQALDTDNTYGNLNRSTHSYWAGQRLTTAVTPSINLIDQANIGAGVFTAANGLQNKGPGPDFWLTSQTIYYKLKQEALSRGQHVTVDNMPGAAELGVEHECIKYGRNTITYDPNLTGDWSAYDSDVSDATKLMVGFNSEDWIFTAHPDENFRVTPFEYQGKTPGGDDAVTATINLMYRLRCRKPWRSVVLTNVS